MGGGRGGQLIKIIVVNRILCQKVVVNGNKAISQFSVTPIGKKTSVINKILGQKSVLNKI